MFLIFNCATFLLSLNIASSLSTDLLIRYKRQEDDGLDDESRSGLCDFGSAKSLQLCSWTISMDAHPNIRWALGQGTDAFWLGGPLKDHSVGDATGGYAYFETSYKAINRVFSSAALESGYGSDQKISIKDDFGDNKTDTRQDRGLITTTSQLNVYKDALISTPDIIRSIIPNVAHLTSPNISRTGPLGFCISFYYNIDGLSADRLRILVRDMQSGTNQTLWESRLHSDGNWIKSEIAYSYNEQHQIILEGIAKTSEEPERAYRGYIAIDDIQIEAKGEGADAICHGHCTFEGGFCGWTNEEEKDDFDWKEARGSNNFFTGPVRDYYSFSKEYPLGGYIYIDASYPRRPGDIARLISPQFEATGENGPLCFVFATHMYGNGIGTLRVKYRSTESGEEVKDKTLWEMTGEAGNYWYLAQLPIASSTPYHIIFEGVVGLNYLGNIAVDNVGLEQGSCPISPQTASQKSGDCTFEENMCFWTNPLAHSNVDDFDWIRQFSFGNYGPKRDHTKMNANGYFLSLNGDVLQPKRGGTLAWIISPEFTPSANAPPKCISFYYFMYQRIIESSGPSLGGLRVYIRTTDSKGDVVLLPVWRLNNHQSMRWRHAQASLSMKKGDEFVPPSHSYQVVIEGVWGDARVGSIALDDINFYDGHCQTFPLNAKAVLNECFFDNTLCNWKNETKRSTIREGQLSLGQINTKSDRPVFSTRKQGESLTWRLATPNSRPANLQDHTFRAPIGYIFFDVFNQNTLQQPVLRSPKFPPLEGEVTKQCLTFWFSGFGRGDSTSLNVYHVVEGEGGDQEQPSEATDQAPSKGKSGEVGNRVLLWKIQTRLIDTRRPMWHFGQVTVNAETAYELIFEGEATDGGFAIDDITFYNGTCQIRPSEAAVNVKTEAE